MNQVFKFQRNSGRQIEGQRRIFREARLLNDQFTIAFGGYDIVSKYFFLENWHNFGLLYFYFIRKCNQCKPRILLKLVGYLN